jgi:hypothetical protein
VAFHEDAGGLLDGSQRFWVALELASRLRIGLRGRLQLGESPLCHLEDGQRLHEEFRCRLGDVLELVGGPVGLENIQEHGVVDSGEVQYAQVLPYGPPAKLVGGLEPRLTAVGQVLEEGGSVVAPEPLVGVPHPVHQAGTVVETRPTTRSAPGRSGRRSAVCWALVNGVMSPSSGRLGSVEAIPEQPLQALQTLFQVACGVDVVEAYAQAHHRKGDRWLDADDDRFRAA